MAVEVIMPKIDENMKEGKIVEWLKHEGDRVNKGDILFVIETEKVIWDVEADTSGVLSKPRATTGDVIPVGTVVAFILEPGEREPELHEVKHEAVDVSQKEGVLPVGEKGEVKKDRASRGMRASPLAKRFAREYGIDLTTINGTGGDGCITQADVERAIEARKNIASDTKTANRRTELMGLSLMRATIAKRMTQSFQHTPHFYLSLHIDATELINTRKAILEEVERLKGVRLTITDLLIKTVASALEEHPKMNVQWQEGKLLKRNEINIGIAVATKEGLIVPVVHGANQKKVSEISTLRFELVQRARERRMRPDEMKGGSITITNLGMFGIEQAISIINPPESAILAVGSIIDKPVVIDNKVCIRPLMNLTLSIDHRVLDGAMGSGFLQTVKLLTESPPDDMFII